MAFTDPASNLEHLGLHEGMVVADLGAGSGFYTFAAAKLVEGGKVYAVDVLEDLLVRLKNAAQQQHVNNIEVIHANMEELGGTHIREGSVDAAIVSNVLFQIENREGFLNEIRRILKRGGRVLVIDWSDSFGSMGPQPDMVITEDKAREMFKSHGFTEIKAFDTGDHHYGLVFSKS